jgi:hypothetical protein
VKKEGEGYIYFDYAYVEALSTQSFVILIIFAVYIEKLK